MGGHNQATTQFNGQIYCIAAMPSGACKTHIFGLRLWEWRPGSCALGDHYLPRHQSEPGNFPPRQGSHCAHGSSSASRVSTHRGHGSVLLGLGHVVAGGGLLTNLLGGQLGEPSAHPTERQVSDGHQRIWGPAGQYLTVGAWPQEGSKVGVLSSRNPRSTEPAQLRRLGLPSRSSLLVACGGLIDSSPATARSIHAVSRRFL